MQHNHLLMLEQWSEIFQNTPANGPPSLGAERNLISQLSGKADSLSPEIQKVLLVGIIEFLKRPM